MAHHSFSFQSTLSDQELTDDIADWFSQKDFDVPLFERGKFSIYYGEIAHRLAENPGYTTFYAKSTKQSMLVFEVKVEDNRVDVECYSPILLFGFFPKKFAFKAKAGILTGYLAKGHQVMMEFQKEFANGMITGNPNTHTPPTASQF